MRTLKSVVNMFKVLKEKRNREFQQRTGIYKNKVDVLQLLKNIQSEMKSTIGLTVIWTQY